LQQQFHCVVNGSRVRLVGVVDNRLDRLDVFTEVWVLDIRLARPHPVDVALDGVELAIVDDIPVRVSQMPGPECVR
jgi:hypothetical protein